jgi:REP element-mobilizing transposase RayT
MPSPRIIKEQKDLLYFVTFTVYNWYYIFDRHNRFKILEDSFVYCQQHKGLEPNLINVIRDMKTFLSHEIQKNIIATEPDVLSLFKINDKKYKFWQDGNYPITIETDKFYNQKYNYIIYNPVAKGYVSQPEDWRWSSVSKTPTRIKITNY